MNTMPAIPQTDKESSNFSAQESGKIIESNGVSIIDEIKSK
jgi:hypothetical protein